MLIREIEQSDLAAITDLFAETFPRRRHAYWQRGFDNMCLLPSIPGHPRYGYLLEDDNAVQAALLLLTGRLEDGQPQINFSTWCARPTYQAMAVLLHTRAMKQIARAYFNLSPAAHVAPILDVMGFKPYTRGICLLDARAALRPGRNCRLVCYDPSKNNQLPPALAVIAARHYRYGCTVLMVENAAGIVDVFVYRIKWIKGLLPCAQMIRGSPELILASAGPLMRYLLARAIPVALLDLADEVRMVGARTYVGRSLRYAKGRPPTVGDMLDTEFALFGP